MSTFVNKLKRITGGLMIIFAAAVALEATNVVQYLYSQRVLREEAKKRAESQLETNRIRIMDVVDQAEAAVRNSVWIARWCLEVPDSLHVVARRIVEDNPVVVGSTVALVPGYKGRGQFSPYAFRDGDKISFASLATEAYDYPSQEWFTKPIELGAGYWSEPYFDEGGGNMLMTTYSLPITDASGKVAAGVTADISLEWLTEMIEDAQVYPHSFGIVLSRAGQIMVSPIETLTMRASINDFSDQAEDKLQYDSLSTEWMVIHAVPGENAPGEPEYLKREPLTDFFAPMTAQCGAWMRIDCSDEAAKRAAEYCRLTADEHVLFDNDYLLEDTTELYCCELVWRAYLREGIDISDGHRGDVPTVICKEGECIFPSHIENSKNTLFVKQFKTKKS